MVESIVDRRNRLYNARRAELQAAQEATHAAGLDCDLFDCFGCVTRREMMHRGTGPEFISHHVAKYRESCK